jgi:CheY-like chemotaxis protein
MTRNMGRRTPQRGSHGVASWTAVLVVDGDPDNEELLSFTIEHAVATVSGGNDAVAALQVLGTRVPDILRIDLSMPRMDGYELLATLAAAGRFDGSPPSRSRPMPSTT